MKEYKLIQIYVIPANTKREAMDKWLRTEPGEFFQTSIVKLVEEQGILATMKRQIAG
jgi:hypothetical protein